ncbi:precorrin-3B C(17)-methyltransferase [Paraburkholderia solisilvae]|uniref:Siroheme synthase n=1 Tax=Paraburkholderia solisilvae TaxID=624376 RepID=A0A6J5DBX9_9BURK|nr:precorrin-3B C(17)-methyltransferase [Paraburkholderia solisilvae]CAB3751758.1 Siroheme synthase [Paraburkholderia solisilvae]
MARLKPPAIIVLGSGATATARRIAACYPDARVHGLRGRVQAGSGATAADVLFDELGAHLRELYASGTPIVALCAAGIVIRCVASLLANKGAEPPVLAVAEDGSAVAPLLGGLAGVNVMAREIAAALDVPPAITTSGELRFGTCVLNPPEGYALASLAQGKRFVSDLLAGESTRIEGDAHWLDDAQLPRSADAQRAIRITPHAWDGNIDELVIHPRSVVVALTDGEDAAQRIRDALAAQALSPLALAAIVAPAARMGDEAFEQAARALNAPLRFADVADVTDGTNSANGTNAAAVMDVKDSHAAPASLSSRALLTAALDPDSEIADSASGVALAVAAGPVDVNTIGRARGRLTVIGLGPGSADLMVPAARAALDQATDILGYATYVEMAGPFRADQQVHPTDNREEMQRARRAFELASGGRRVVMVSSGDPGVFAMASAVLEALDASDAPEWADVELEIVPGVSAAMATAAQAGAPLGHDFCMLSLSDNLKPWSIIETRIAHAAQADLVMAFYNPVSRARPWQLDKALDIVREFRAPETVVVLGRDIGRPGASLVTMTLGELKSADVDMRTMVIIGSSTTREFVRRSAHGAPREWVYTPRWYR